MTAVWRRSSRCETAACVEIATLPDGRVGIRDSKHPDREPLVWHRAQWTLLCDAIHGGYTVHPDTFAPHVFTPGELSAFAAGVLNRDFDGD